MTAEERDQIIIARYPQEGASESLCMAVQMHAWQIRHRATRHLRIRVNDAVKAAHRNSYKWLR